MANNNRAILSADQWNEAASMIAAGKSWAQAGFALGVPATKLKTEGEKRGLKKGFRPQIEFVSMGPESAVFLKDEPDLISVDPTDPEQCLIGVRQKLTTVVNGIERTILEPENEAEWMAGTDPVSRFAQNAKKEGYGVAHYVSILKDIAKLATAHMPYRHATRAAIAIKDMSGDSGIKTLSREEKRKRLTTILEQAGVVDA